MQGLYQRDALRSQSTKTAAGAATLALWTEDNSVEGIDNFRDFAGHVRGGLRVRKGMIYRSGSMYAASTRDLELLSSLGVRTICDLRTHKEKKRYPDRIPDSVKKTVHIPVKVSQHDESAFIFRLFSLLFGPARRLNFAALTQEVYRELAAAFQAEFSKVVKLAGDEGNLPMLIHCTAGKDRTGFACSLLQLMLGLPREQVFLDYLASNEHLDGLKREMMKSFFYLSLFGVSAKKFLPLLDARSEYLEAAFQQIDADYGSFDHYLLYGLGISDSDKSRLRQIFLER
jgi:protein-tyrosine phosphatase